MITSRLFVMGIMVLFLYLHDCAAPASGADIQGFAVITHIEGQVEIQRAGSTEWRPAETQNTLVVGDIIRTSKNSRATLRLADQSNLDVGEEAKLTVRTLLIDEDTRTVVNPPNIQLPPRTGLIPPDHVLVEQRKNTIMFMAPFGRLELPYERSSAQSEKDPDPPPASNRWRIP